MYCKLQFNDKLLR